MLTSKSLSRRLAAKSAGVLTLALVAGGLMASTPAQAASFQRGPAPTVASISATTGPFATTTKTISGSGFGGETVYYPTSTAQGTYGVVAIIPGFISTWSEISWLGPRLASQGFVVLGIDTSTLFDFPTIRAAEFTAAIAAAKANSTIASVGDFSRVAIAGWSMGGGGALDAAASAAAGTYKAVIPMAPWEVTNNAAKVTAPTLIFSGQGDPIAPAASMSSAFYSSLPGQKALIDITNGSHFFPTTPNTALAAAAISWLKIFVDNDSRYTQFICPNLAVSTGTDSFKESCTG